MDPEGTAGGGEGEGWGEEWVRDAEGEGVSYSCAQLIFCIQGISGNLEMSGNSAKVREKTQSQGKVWKGQGYLNWHNACDVHGHMCRTSYNLPCLLYTSDAAAIYSV